MHHGGGPTQAFRGHSPPTPQVTRLGNFTATKHARQPGTSGTKKRSTHARDWIRTHDSGKGGPQRHASSNGMNGTGVNCSSGATDSILSQRLIEPAVSGLGILSGGLIQLERNRKFRMATKDSRRYAFKEIASATYYWLRLGEVGFWLRSVWAPMLLQVSSPSKVAANFEVA